VEVKETHATAGDKIEVAMHELCYQHRDIIAVLRAGNIIG
jgi:hypothetical protein